MAIEIPGFKFSLPAGADLSALQFTFVKLNNAGQVIACAATTDIPVGVLQNKPNAAGVPAEVMASGITKIKTAAATVTGSQIGTDGAGLAAIYVNGTDTTKYGVGQQVVATGAASGIGSALINCMAPGRMA